jgi:hypothetical protein
VILREREDSRWLTRARDREREREREREKGAGAGAGCCGLCACARERASFLPVKALILPSPPCPPRTQVFNTKWSEYPGGVEYFDVYMGPITHRYSEVFWTSLPETPVRCSFLGFKMLMLL